MLSNLKWISIFLPGILLVFSCKKEYSCENCREINLRPIANAGPDQVVTLPLDSAFLNGASSFDPDGTITGWRWTKIAGPATFIISTPMGAITPVKNLVAGTYQFELNVTDNGGLSSRDTMIVIVDPLVTINHPPVANAGGDVSLIVSSLPIAGNHTAILDASASYDPDNDIISFFWTKISGPPSPYFSMDNPGMFQLQVSNLTEGICQFELKVTDSKGLVSRDTAQVKVVVRNGPPVANSGPDQTLILPTNSTWLDGRNSVDPDQNIKVHSWTKISGPASFNILSPGSALTHLEDLEAGIYEFELLVIDAGGLYSTDRIKITVN